MKTISLTQDQQLALGILVSGIVLVIALVVMPVISLALDYQESKEKLLKRIDNQKRVLATKEDVALNLENIQTQINEHSFFSSQPTEALTSVDMQNTIKTIVTDAGAELNSTQGLPSETRDDLTKVIVSVNLIASLDVLTEILRSFNSATPFLMINQIEIRPITDASSNNAKQSAPVKLHINMQVLCFMKSPQS
ncbi:MAG: hypothetical protein EBR59_09640 [Methylococcaceae bacterium]|nr:hypothetical protein [Methylococcaceae bacterium]